MSKHNELWHRRVNHGPSTLGHRLALALTVFILGLALLVLAIAYVRDRRGLLTEASSQLAGQARLVSQRIESALRERERLALLWPQLEASQDLAIDDIDKRLANSLEHLAGSFGPRALAIALDSLHRVVAASRANWIGSALPFRWLPALEHADSAALWLQNDPRLGWLLVAVSDVHTQVGGRRLGEIVLLTPWSELMAEAAPYDRFALRIQTQSGGRIRQDSVFQERNVLLVEHNTEPVSRVQLRIAAAMTQAQALRPLRTTQRQLAGFAGLLLLLALPASLLLVRTNTKALEGLTRTALAVQAQQDVRFDRVPERAPREVRVLAEALQEMVVRLDQSRRELARQESLVAMGTMAAGLAHEIRTPLSVLRGSAELLARTADRSDREREVTTFIMDEVARLERLVQDLLTFARPREPQFAPLDLAAVAQRVVSALTTQAQTMGITFSTTLQPAALQGDAGQLYQVALNLTSNALQASTRGGAVELATGTQPEPPVAWLDVRDHGHGISADDAGRIWLPFYSTRSGGTGLGLAIVRRIIDQHGGIIQLSSEPGQGTRVRVELPQRGEVS